MRFLVDGMSTESASPAGLKSAPVDWATLALERNENRRARAVLSPFVAGIWAAVAGPWTLALAWVLAVFAITYYDRVVWARTVARAELGHREPSVSLQIWTFFQMAVWGIPGLYLWPTPGYGGALGTILLTAATLNAVVSLRASGRLVMVGALPNVLLMGAAPILSTGDRGVSAALIATLIGTMLLVTFSYNTWRSLNGADLAKFQALEAARHAREEAEAADRAKADFMRLLSQELRTPAAALAHAGRQFQSAQMQLSPDLRTQLLAVADASEVLSAAVEDLLAGSQTGGAGAPTALRAVDLRALMRHAVEAWRSAAQDKWLEMFLDVDAAAPEMVLVDAVRLKQAVYALLSHALDATQHGGVRVRVGCAPGKDERSVRLLIAVSAGADGEPVTGSENRRRDLALARRLAGAMGAELILRENPGSAFITALRFEAQAAAPDPSPARDAA